MGSDFFTFPESVAFWSLVFAGGVALATGFYDTFFVGGKNGLEDVREKGRPELWPNE